MARDMIPEAETPTGDKTSPTEVRKRWIAELRRQGHRKCAMDFIEFNDDGMVRVCALGLLGEIAGIDPDTMHCMTGSDIGALAGLRLWQCQDIVARNDGTRPLGGKTLYRKHTFPEIADVVEGFK